MKTPLALRNLLHDKVRSVVALAGVTFAVVLILMQLGFYGSVEQTATTIYKQLEFDILLTSPQYLHISKPSTLPRARLEQAASVRGVASVSPLYLGFNLWLNKASSNRPQAQRRGIFVMAQNLNDTVFRLPEVRAQRSLLRVPGHVLMDTRSRQEFQPWYPGWTTEVGRKQIEVVGAFTLGSGFGADGAIITSLESFLKLFPARTRDQVSLGLVRLDPQSGANPSEVAERIRALFPARRDVRVLTRAEIEEQERHHWVNKTSVGFIFSLGAVVGFLVGTAIVYQVLASDIANHLAEYATLKAMGYGPGYLAKVVLQQALILAFAGYLPGLLIAQGMYWLTSEGAHIPMQMTWQIRGLVLALSLAMCSMSGLFSLRKVFGADPADLF